MSTLNEIAANHARMAKAKEEESIRLSEFHAQVLGGFELPSVDVTQESSLFFMPPALEHTFVEGTGCTI
ncbi:MULTISPECIES: hypothetical protein [unclassified Pseudomonas]|uniref:hypothetical protein n=1 Tax=unclassified Pseudomonas TaxID=196821 RepID=UPI0011994DDD|nr:MULTISPECIES: hypothetical protein [unclassified Pseudomonas]TWC12301.1 hypothetical protein FBY00_12683 [Pseudomonas sp. SJZ075]TWC17031.1 hypothetical protein FBX99_11819 [Pseudomonas sp. SJZ074]TWC28816.1 hypothetical protein FBY02_12783 [Pseudomonas sp. SJZ078]TWC35215.1 hypothetical protein FBY06_118125 [Pseudomonas sp. SJZ085]TWC49065.1 hypothetical protein FBY11_12683 [Pseudomonas sp. SJZ124]